LCRWDALDRTAIRRTAQLVLEKVPLFLVIAAHAFITFQTQSVARSTMSAIPLKQRALNAIISYNEYLRDTLFPTGLAAFYPFPFGENLAGFAIASGVLLGAITVLILWFWRRAPYLVVGWFWFLGTLVPVIGIVQVGLQARADRYMYIPSVGLFIGVAWWAAHVGVKPRWRNHAAAFAVAIVVACTVASAMQSRYWNNTLALFERALDVTEDNLIAYTNVAGEYVKRGDKEKAREHFETAVAIDKKTPWGAVAANAYFGLAQLAEEAGELGVAEINYLEARNRKPGWSEATNNLAGVYMTMGNRAFQNGDVESGTTLFQTAMTLAGQALQTNPNNYEAMTNLAYLCQHFGGQSGDDALLVQSASLYEDAISNIPPSAPVHYNFALVLRRLGRVEDAIRQLETALAIDPGFEKASSLLASLAERRNTVGGPAAQTQ